MERKESSWRRPEKMVFPGKLSDEEQDLNAKFLELARLKDRLKAEKGLRNNYFFAREIIEQDEKRREKIVPHVHGEWWKWYRNSSKRLKMILVPRGTLKSTIFTVDDPIRRIAANRNERILISNAVLANAQRFLGEIKQHLRQNEELIKHYGEFYDPNLKWNEDEIEVSGRSSGTREPTVSAIGVGGTLVSQHYSRIIWDDPVGEMNIGTRSQALKVIDWWKRTISLLDPDGEGLIIGTRWADFDLYQYIIDELGEEVDVFIRGAYNEDGSLYYPELLSEEKLRELRKIEGSYIFSCFYLNDPIDSDSSLIQRSNIHYYDSLCPCGEYHRKPDNSELKIFAGCDPAYSTDLAADESAIVVVGVDRLDNWFVLDVQGGRWDVTELTERLFDIYRTWSPESITLETVGVGKSVLNPIHTEEARRGEYLPLYEIKGRGAVDKDKRLRSLLPPRFQRNKVFLSNNQPDLEDQLTRYPRSMHDDYLDALADITEIAYQPAGSSRPDHMEETDSLIQQGVWRITIPGEDDGYVDPHLGSMI